MSNEINDTRDQQDNNSTSDSHSTVETHTSVQAHTAADTHTSQDADGKAFRLYTAALDRTPDHEGLLNWATALTGGQSLTAVASGFVHSAEFEAKYGSATSNDAFVDVLYQNVLHRSADAAGHANWVAALDHGGSSREAVLVGFSESAENQSRVSEMLHGIDYQTYVG